MPLCHLLDVRQVAAHAGGALIAIVVVPVVVDVGAVVDIIQADQQNLVAADSALTHPTENGELPAGDGLADDLVELFLPGPLTDHLVVRHPLVAQLLAFLLQLHPLALQFVQQPLAAQRFLGLTIHELKRLQRAIHHAAGNVRVVLPVVNPTR